MQKLYHKITKLSSEPHKQSAYIELNKQLCGTVQYRYGGLGLDRYFRFISNKEENTRFMSI